LTPDAGQPNGHGVDKNWQADTIAIILILADSDDRDRTFDVFHTESSRNFDRLLQFPQL
jgi:hypothetical protein